MNTKFSKLSKFWKLQVLTLKNINIDTHVFCTGKQFIKWRIVYCFERNHTLHHDYQMHKQACIEKHNPNTLRENQ